MSNKPGQFQNYNDMREFAVGGRWPEKGRRIGSWGHMRLVNEQLQLQIGGVHLASLMPDNVLTFVAEMEDVKYAQVSISQNLPKVVPLVWVRTGMCKWRMNIIQWKTQRVDKYLYVDWTHHKRYAPEYFPGIKFDLSAKKCLNARADEAKRVQPDQQKEWIKAMRRYCQGLLVRIKLGILDGMETSYEDNWVMTADFLYKCMVEDEYPREMLQYLRHRATRWRWYGGAPRNSLQDCLRDEVKALISRYRTELRRRFGVFHD